MGDIGRLAMRKEGHKWVAYYAVVETMTGAIVLGSISMGIASNEDYKRRFMELMQDAVGDIIEEKTGSRPDWGDPHGAPEHERAGNA